MSLRGRPPGLASAGLFVQGLTLHKGERRVLDALSAAFPAGTLSVLVGPNGAGKTTLLRASCRIELPRYGEGEVLWGEVSLSKAGPPGLRKRIAYLPAAPNLPFPVPVRDLIEAGEPTPGGAARAIAALELGEFLDRPVNRLSSGEARRAWLAMTLARDTPVILLDEPLNGLDPRHQLGLLDELARRAREGDTVVLALHELTMAARADRAVAISAGQVVAQGPPVEVLTPGLLREIFAVEVATLAGAGVTALVPARTV